MDRIGLDAAFLEGDGVRVPAMHKEKFARRAPFDAERSCNLLRSPERDVNPETVSHKRVSRQGLKTKESTGEKW